MAKTPICWTIHNDWMGTRILAVTSIQPYEVFGRQIRGESDERPTHVKRERCAGCFNNLPAAQAALAEIKAIRQRYAQQRTELEQQMTAAHNAELRELGEKFGTLEYKR